MSWQGQQPPAYNPAYNSSSGNPSAPPAQAPYNPSYQQAPPGGYGGAPQGYGGTPQGYGGAPQGYGGAPQGYGGAHAGGYAPPPAGYGGAPGYGAPGSTGSGAPPGADPTLWSWFQAVNLSGSGSIKAEELQQALLNANWSHFNRETCDLMAVDANHSNSITAAELRQALVNGNWTAFNEETCRLMIGMFDRDRDGTINFQEFAALWNYIQEWNKCFQRFDTDRSGNIDANELRTAFVTFGYNLSPQFSQFIVTRFDRANRNTINFDDFIQCCVMLKSLSEAFKKKDRNMTGTINIYYEEFLEMVLENALY